MRSVCCKEHNPVSGNYKVAQVAALNHILLPSKHKIDTEKPKSMCCIKAVSGDRQHTQITGCGKKAQPWPLPMLGETG